MIRSISDQIAGMAELCPQFKLMKCDKRFAIWIGRFTPLHRSYLLRVFYRQSLAIENLTLRDIQPRVQVLDPVLERHPEYEDGPIPHVYVSKATSELPYLCLFDPDQREWSPADLIAETTIPWAGRWLCFYEGWLATGRWRGGGRHPGESSLQEKAA